MPGGFVWSSDQRLTLTSAIRLTEEQIVAYLGAIACPTLLVRAEPAPKWLPPALMDVLQAVNLGISAILLMVAVYIRSPLAFVSFGNDQPPALLGQRVGFPALAPQRLRQHGSGQALLPTEALRLQAALHRGSTLLGFA